MSNVFFACINIVEGDTFSAVYLNFRNIPYGISTRASTKMTHPQLISTSSEGHNQLPSITITRNSRADGKKHKQSNRQFMACGGIIQPPQEDGKSYGYNPQRKWNQ